MNIDIKMLTAECPREDCAIAILGSSTTLRGWSQTYNKAGEAIGHNPNTTTTMAGCRSCNKRWEVVTKSGETTIKELG